MKKLLSTLLFLFVIAILSLSAQNRIYPPNLVSPDNGDDDQMPDVVLNWAAVSGSGGIVSYQIQVDVTDAFTSPFIDETTEFTGFQMNQLLFGQEYFWRVKAMEGSNVSDWSEVFSFVIFETIDLNKPNDGSDEQMPDVTLKAKDRIGAVVITGIDYYEFQADTSANFDSPLLFHGMADTNFLDAMFLHFGETYYWRARVGHGADACAWSEARTLETVFGVILEEPSSGEDDMGLANELLWEEISGVLDYEVQIAHDDIFTNPHSMIVEDIMYVTDGYLTFDNEYFWRVRANHGTDTSDWSEVWNFTTIDMVNLSSPENGATDIGINPRLEWDEVSGVDYYHVQYNESNTFDNPCCDELVEGSDNFFQVIYILDKGKTYYWRCRTMQGIDTTAWSEVWSFTTEEEIGINENAFDESNISIYPNPNQGQLTININTEKGSEVMVHVMDLLGHVYFNESVVFTPGSVQTFDLSNLANGLYLVKLVNGEQSYTQKITIHK